LNIFFFSYFNWAEISIVLSYIENLINGTNQHGQLQGTVERRNNRRQNKTQLHTNLHKPMKKITIDDIGVIAPYKSQCRKFTSECKKRNWGAIKIGSLEIFQGQEKPVIIVSTVRSNMRSVGFLGNYRVEQINKCANRNVI
jgi:hypothetical protein